MGPRRGHGLTALVREVVQSTSSNGNRRIAIAVIVKIEVQQAGSGLLPTTAATRRILWRRDNPVERPS